MPVAASAMSGVEWFWWVAVVAALLLAWSLTPIRPRGPGRSPGAMTRGTLAIHPLLWARHPDEVAALLGHHPGVQALELDLAHGQARVTFDPRATSIATLESFVDECARHCVGTRAPAHSCPPDLNDSKPAAQSRLSTQVPD